MSFYADMAGLAQEMLAEFGAKVTLSSTTAEFNKRTGRVESSTDSSLTCLAVLLEPTPLDNERSRIVQTTTLILTKPPVEGGTVTMGTRKWTVSQVSTLQPANTPVLYMAEVE